MRGLLVAAALLAAPTAAHAFCGFYVAGSDKPMFNDATQVVLMRDGTRTVLSMQNNYKGPPEAFAMVIPVPAVLHEGDVKTLPPEVFQHVDTLGSPRLVEYWEMDPCQQEPPEEEDMSGGTGTAMALDEGKMGKKDSDYGVKVEAKFNVAEYQIVILSATESTGLDAWLRDQNYKIPAGAAPLLRPYVENNMKFFVAKVDPTKVKFVDGRADLSPLRVAYDSEAFTLPIRLGLANSSGTQDLIVNIIAKDRYETTNYENVTIPTNLDVKNAVKERFAEFYVALFDAVVAKNPGAVVTEYAWSVSNCDPCPGPALDGTDIGTLGGDVMPNISPYDMTLTRLHARYGTSIKDDLSFGVAGPIEGGREDADSENDYPLDTGWKKAGSNNFQARYVIRHHWKGALTCTHPIRNRWGGPWPSVKDDGGTKPAQKLAFAPRTMSVSSALIRALPGLGLQPTKGGLENKAGAAAGDTTPKKKSGCGCESADASGGLVFCGFIGAVMFFRPRSRRRRHTRA